MAEGTRQSGASRAWTGFGGPLLLLAGLASLSFLNYLLFHVVAELLTVAVAVGVLAIA